VAYTSDTLQSLARGCSDDFNCYLLVIVFPLPYVCKTATVQRVALTVVAERKSERLGDDFVTTARLVQCPEALHPDPWSKVEGFQCLVNRWVRVVLFSTA
jgi:hypothetical protein